MTFSARLQRRNFTDFIIPPTFEMRPLRWSWKSLGGPEYAEIAIDGSSAQMWDALNYLRCPVTIYSGAVPVWWGFVQDVGYTDGPVSVTVSLKSMSNKVTVAYSLVEAARQSAREQPPQPLLILPAPPSTAQKSYSLQWTIRPARRRRLSVIGNWHSTNTLSRLHNPAAYGKKH